MSYTPSKVKHGKLKMSSPVQDNDARGGIVSPKPSPRFGKISGGAGTRKHLTMEGPDLSGGGWVNPCPGKKKR